MNFIANYTLDHIGIRQSILFSILCQTLCSMIRMFIDSSIWYVYVAHTIGAIGGPFCGNAISKISTHWFLPENRMLATAFMASSFMLGTSLSFSLGGWFIGDGLTIQELQESINNLLLFTFLLTLSINILILFLFREKPNVPTCFISNYPRDNFCDAIKAMALNGDFRFLCFGFSFF